MSTAQVPRTSGIFVDMAPHEPERADDSGDGVRCLACGTPYAVGDTVPGGQSGCPACGNLTWIASSFAPRGELERRRSGVDPQRSQTC